MTASNSGRIIWDIVCIIILLIIPDILLDKIDLYRAIKSIAEEGDTDESK